MLLNPGTVGGHFRGIPNGRTPMSLDTLTIGLMGSNGCHFLHVWFKDVSLTIIESKCISCTCAQHQLVRISLCLFVKPDIHVHIKVDRYPDINRTYSSLFSLSSCVGDVCQTVMSVISSEINCWATNPWGSSLWLSPQGQVLGCLYGC